MATVCIQNCFLNVLTVGFSQIRSQMFDTSDHTFCKSGHISLRIACRCRSFSPHTAATIKLSTYRVIPSFNLYY